MHLKLTDNKQFGKRKGLTRAICHGMSKGGRIEGISNYIALMYNLYCSNVDFIGILSKRKRGKVEMKKNLNQT